MDVKVFTIRDYCNISNQVFFINKMVDNFIITINPKINTLISILVNEVCSPFNL